MPEMEKLTINLTPVDLGRIELLVEQGVYANRAEFIRTAIQGQLGKHEDAVRETAARQSMVVGAMVYSRRGLEEIRAKGERIHLRVVGILSIADDVTPELAREVIESVKVRGIYRAGAAVKEALADRTS